MSHHPHEKPHEKPHERHEESGPHEKLKPEEIARRKAEMQKHKAEAMKARAEMLEYFAQQPPWKWDNFNKTVIINEAHKVLSPGNSLGRNATAHTPSPHVEVQKKFQEGEATLKASLRNAIAKEASKIFKSNTIKATLALAAPILAESHKLQDAYTYCKKVMDFKKVIDQNQFDAKNLENPDANAEPFKASSGEADVNIRLHWMAGVALDQSPNGKEYRPFSLSRGPINPVSQMMPNNAADGPNVEEKLELDESIEFDEDDFEDWLAWVEQLESQFWLDIVEIVDRTAPTRVEQIAMLNLIENMMPRPKKEIVFPVDVLMKHVDTLVKHYNAHNRHPSDLYRLVANADRPFSRILVVQCLQVALTQVELPEDATTPPPWISPRLPINLICSKAENDTITSHLKAEDRQLLHRWSQAELRTIILDHGIPAVAWDVVNAQLRVQSTTLVSMRNTNSIRTSCTSKLVRYQDDAKEYTYPAGSFVFVVDEGESTERHLLSSSVILDHETQTSTTLVCTGPRSPQSFTPTNLEADNAAILAALGQNFAQAEATQSGNEASAAMELKILWSFASCAVWALPGGPFLAGAMSASETAIAGFGGNAESRTNVTQSIGRITQRSVEDAMLHKAAVIVQQVWNFYANDVQDALHGYPDATGDDFKQEGTLYLPVYMPIEFRLAEIRNAIATLSSVKSRGDKTLPVLLTAWEVLISLETLKAQIFGMRDGEPNIAQNAILANKCTEGQVAIRALVASERTRRLEAVTEVKCTHTYVERGTDSDNEYRYTDTGDDGWISPYSNFSDMKQSAHYYGGLYALFFNKENTERDNNAKQAVNNSRASYVDKLGKEMDEMLAPALRTADMWVARGARWKLGQVPNGPSTKPSTTIPPEAPKRNALQSVDVIYAYTFSNSAGDESRFAESTWQKLDGASAVTVQFSPDPLGSAGAGRVIYRMFRNGTTFESDTWAKVKLFPENTTLEWKDDTLESGYAAEVTAKAEQTEETKKRKAKRKELRVAKRESANKK